MTARTELDQELDGSSAVLDLLADHEIADLLMMVRAAKYIEVAALAESVDKTIGALPWPFRAPTKKIMFGNQFG